MSPYAKAAIAYPDLPARFAATVTETVAQLRQIDEAASRERRRPGAWSRREILGHLLDSAVNNHLRFVRAAIDGHYEGPSYQQIEWVRLHAYEECSWRELVDWWQAANQRLAWLVAKLPAAAMNAPCQIEGDISAPLGALIADYLGHIEHHLAQIA